MAGAGIAAVSTIGLVLLLRPLADRLGLVARPSALVVTHVHVTPVVGGICAAISVFVALLLTRVELGEGIALALAVGGAGFAILGLTDDRFPFRPFSKLALQFIIAIGACAAAPALAGTAPADWLLFTVAVLWIVVAVNSVNVTDVCDGLMTGLVAIAAAGIALARPELAPYALVLAGAALGVLCFNFPPASIFQGDAGSLFAGFWLAMLLLPREGGSVDAADIAVAALILWVFLFETAFISTMRRRQGLAWWRGSPDHFSLRMQKAGLSKARTIGIAWGLALVPTAAAIAIAHRHTAGLPLAALTLLLSIACWRWLARR